jgi:hypothetical protein
VSAPVDGVAVEMPATAPDAVVVAAVVVVKPSEPLAPVVVVVVVVGVVVVVVVGVVVGVVVVVVVGVVVVVVVGVVVVVVVGVVVVVVVGVVVVGVVVVVVVPLAGQVCDRTKNGSPPSPAVEVVLPGVITAEASRSVAPAETLIRAPLPLWMKPLVSVTVTSEPLSSNHTVRLVNVLPHEAGRMKCQPSWVVKATPPGSRLQSCVPNETAVMPSKPAPSCRQAPAGGEVVQSGAVTVAPPVTVPTPAVPRPMKARPAVATAAPAIRVIDRLWRIPALRLTC